MTAYPRTTHPLRGLNEVFLKGCVEAAGSQNLTLHQNIDPRVLAVGKRDGWKIAAEDVNTLRVYCNLKRYLTQNLAVCQILPRNFLDQEAVA